MKQNYGDRCGSIVYDNVLGGLRSTIQRLTKDEMVKEAIAEAMTTGVIRLVNGG